MLMLSLTCRPTEDLWAKAVETLKDEEKRHINFDCSDGRAVVGELLEVAEAKKNLCMQRRWTYRKGNEEEVILRDVFEKMTKWIKKFREVGDLAMQYDPAHAALPWAAVRFILQVSDLDRPLPCI